LAHIRENVGNANLRARDGGDKWRLSRPETKATTRQRRPTRAQGFDNFKSVEKCKRRYEIARVVGGGGSRDKPVSRKKIPCSTGKIQGFRFESGAPQASDEDNSAVIPMVSRKIQKWGTGNFRALPAIKEGIFAKI
jgi:hypothetical protein